MLEIIKKLDAGTVRGLIVATIPLLVLIASFFGVDEAVFQAKLEGWGEKLVALVSLGGIAWAYYARVFKPTPPLTETAAKATQERLMQEQGSREKDQGGFAHPAVLMFLSTLLLMVVAGCAQLGLQTSGGFNDRLAGGYSTVTALYEAISIRIDSRLRVAEMEPDAQKRAAMVAAIKADAQNLKGQVDQAKEGLDVVQSLKGVNFGAAEERLASTLKILEALQRYLEGRT
jgi:hypothetical protein